MKKTDKRRKYEGEMQGPVDIPDVMGRASCSEERTSRKYNTRYIEMESKEESL